MKFGPYEVLGEIGRGGMATVYRALDPRVGRVVALKVLPRELLHDPQFLSRFQREMRTIATLEHPAIVPIYDVGEEDGQPYFVMRYMDGGSLADRLKQGALSLAETLHIFSHLAPALDEMHAKGVVHRDLKPANILFDHAGQPYLSDFGIAKVKNVAVTLTGQAIVGTPTYISPEQAQGQEVDGRADIYALGVILYQMLTGDVPFKADTPMSLLLKHVNEPVPSVCARRPDLPPAIDYVIQRALAKDPSARFASVGEMVGALRAAAQREGESAAPTTVVSPLRQAASQKRKVYLWAGLGFLLLVAMVAGGVFWLAPWGAALALPSPSPVPMVASATPAEVLPSPSATPVAAPTATPSPAPTAVPTATATPLPLAPAIGGADRLAFVARNDIWMMNLDGSDLTQLTLDGAAKTGLQWLPDGDRILYRSGLCLKTVSVSTLREDILTCLTSVQFIEGAQVSPDGTRLALSIDRQLYILPFTSEVLAGLRSRPDVARAALCRVVPDIATKDIRWGSDGQSLAVQFAGVAGARRVDLIRVLQLRSCADGGVAEVWRLDEFPAQRFTMSGYTDNPVIPDFSWNEAGGFLLHSGRRNGGFGNLYVYHIDTHKAQMLDPLGTTCCYRDARWSPDGLYIAFAYQDINLGAQSQTELYLVPFGLLGTGAVFEPLPLPPDFFNRTDSPQLIFRPVE